MIYALLLLGLLPAALLPDFLSGNDDDAEDEYDPQDNESAVDDSLLAGYGDDGSDEVLGPVIEDDDATDNANPDGEILDPVIEDDASETDVVLTPVIEDDFPTDTPQTDPAEVLVPVIEDDTATGGTDPDPSEVLTPVIEDDYAAGSGDEDVLPPVIEDDPGPVGMSSGAIEVTATSPAEITDFDARVDILQVTINPAYASGQLDVVTAPSEDGQDTLVYVDEMLIATLKTSSNLDTSHVVISTDAASFTTPDPGLGTPRIGNV